jgi:hypothetical protein
MKLSQEDIGKAKLDPIFDGLDDKLKDPKEFKKIERKLFSVVQTDHEHKYIVTYMKCKSCQEKLNKKRKLLKLYGFASYEQYLSYKRVMDIIVNQKDIKLK